MSPDRWQKIDSLFQSAVALVGSDRASFLEQECGRDLELRNQIEELLSAHDKAGSFIEKPAVERAARSIANENAESSLRLIGTSISHYQIVSRLGEGGMGVVYLAHDTQLARKVALKVLPDYLTRDPDRLRRFELEARSASVLNHPNIITVHEIGHADSVHFIATEYIEGISLREYFAGRRPELGEVLDIAMQVAAALVAAHAKGIVHRDIKPENIIVGKENPLLDREHYVKVLDFGIAKLTEVASTGTELPTRPMVNTGIGLTMGTAPYMSPEQAQGLPVDGRTDIWSLCVVIYEMVTGQLPFEGPTVSHVIVSILEKDPPPLAAHLPQALRALIVKALNKDPGQRQQTATEVLNDLKSLESDTNIVERAQQLVVGERHEVGSAFTVNVLMTRKRGLMFAVVGLVIVAFAILGTIYLRPDRGTNRAGPFSNLKVKRLTTSGQARFADISPDGNYVVHVMGPAGQQSLYLRHIPTGSDTELVPTNGKRIGDSTFSPDGNFIYFYRIDTEGFGVLNQIPLLGGQPKKVLTDVDTRVSCSPDSKRLAFLRGNPLRGEASLIVANVDGTNEQTLVTHKIRELLPVDAAGPSWSPDGERIAFAFANSSGGTPRFDLAVVQVRDAVERRITSHHWYSIQAICWLGKGSALALTADEKEGGLSRQVWSVSYPAGEVRTITNDSNNYRNLSITKDSKSLLTIQSERICDIWTAPGGDAARVRQITSNRFEAPGTISWTPDNRIVHASRASGSLDIWVMNADGSGDTQLTRNAGSNLNPRVSFDGRYIVFESDRSGTHSIWRMDVDGSNLKQLTLGVNDIIPLCTLDNKSVIYTSEVAGSRRLWKVPIDGGEPEQWTDYTATGLAVSSKDGTIVFQGVNEQSKFRMMLISPNGERQVSGFEVPQIFFQRTSWQVDGSALTFIDFAGGASNIWAQPLDGSPRKQLTNFTSNPDLIFGYGWSRDGKQLAVARGTQTSDIVLLTDLGNEN